MDSHGLGGVTWVGGGALCSHVFDVLKAVSQVADEGVVDMLQHSSLADNVSDALRLDNC
jgi:hypothetical protein